MEQHVRTEGYKGGRPHLATGNAMWSRDEGHVMGIEKWKRLVAKLEKS